MCKHGALPFDQHDPVLPLPTGSPVHDWTELAAGEDVVIATDNGLRTPYAWTPSVWTALSSGFQPMGLGTVPSTSTPIP